jgi:hypothetical protein
MTEKSDAMRVQGLPEGLGDPIRAVIVGGGTGGGPTGGLTNVELRASPVEIEGTVNANVGVVPVTGTFFPPTQPVSGNVGITGSVTVSGPLTDAQLRATPLPVTGSFFPTTQPVSGNVGITGAVAVTGAFFQATQPVSGTVTANINGTVPVTGTFFQATQPVSIAATVGVKKHSQAGRVVRNFILDAFTAAPAAEALQSVIQYYNGAAVAAITTPVVVPAGKVLRLTGGRIETKSLATVGSVVMRVRINPAGLVVIGSPIAASASCGSRAGATTVAMTGGHDHAEFSFGDEGLEIPAGAGVGFTLAGYGPAGAAALQGVTRFEVWGYEYTAS